MNITRSYQRVLVMPPMTSKTNSEENCYLCLCSQPIGVERNCLHTSTISSNALYQYSAITVRAVSYLPCACGLQIPIFYCLIRRQQCLMCDLQYDSTGLLVDDSPSSLRGFPILLKDRKCQIVKCSNSPHNSPKPTKLFV